MKFRKGLFSKIAEGDDQIFRNKHAL